MHPAYSVILFTTASGAGFGLLALLGLVGAAHGSASNPWFGVASLGAGLLLVSGGLVSSLFHLGHPERAWRAFSQWRSSWLSREGVASVATLAAACLFGLLWLMPRAGRPLLALWGLVLFGLCLASLHCTAMIYASLPTIRQWRSRLVPPVYQAFGLATGAALLHALAEGFGRGQPLQSILVLASLAVCGLLKVLYWRQIDEGPAEHTLEAATGLGRFGPVRQWEVPHTSPNFVMREMGYCVARRHAEKLRRAVLGALAAAFLLTALTLLLGGGPLSAGLAALAAAAALGAALVERWLFFAEARHVSALYYGAKRA
jgi:DMSO reductase anchor subunit